MSVSEGNSKIGKVANVSLPPVRSCGNCEGCWEECYARPAYRQYPSTKASWDDNWRMVCTDRPAYWRMIREYIERKAPTLFRWHVAGDIPDQGYLDEMVVIAKQYPKTKFLVFTKMYGLEYTGAIACENLSVVLSAWPGQKIQRTLELPVAWMQDGTETRIPKDAIECSGHCDDCGMCWSLAELGRDVYFHIH